MTTEDLFRTEAGAASVHDRLTELLDPELNNSYWIEFTETAFHHLPALREAGRPTKESILNSFVGKLGFESWSDYLKTPKKHGGLGFNTTSWKRFKEAYAVVKQRPWVRDMNFTYDQVRVLKKAYPAGIPDTRKEYEQIEDDRSAEKKKEKEQRLAKRKEEIEMLPKIKEQNQQLLESEKTLKAKIRELDQRISDCESALAEVRKDRDKYQTLSDERKDQLNNAIERATKAEQQSASIQEDWISLRKALMKLRSVSLLRIFLRLFSAWRETEVHLLRHVSQQRPKAKQPKKKT